MENTDILRAYLDVAATFDAIISSEIIAASINSTNEKNKRLAESILFLRMKAIADNAELLKGKDESEDDLLIQQLDDDELEDELEEVLEKKKKHKYKPTKIQSMNYYLIELAAKCEEKEVFGMAVYAVFRLALPQINAEINKRIDWLNMESDFVDTGVSYNSVIQKLNDDGKNGIYYMAHTAIYLEIADQISKYNHKKASPQTFIAPYYRYVFNKLLNPGKKKNWINDHNKVKKAEKELEMQGIFDPSLEQIVNYINKKSKAKDKLKIESIQENELRFPALQSIYVADEDGNAVEMQISDSRFLPDNIAIQNNFFQRVEEVLGVLPYSYRTLGTIYVTHIFLGEKNVPIKKLKKEYEKIINENVSPENIRKALKEIKNLLKNALKLKKENEILIEWEPAEFSPSEEQMEQDEEDVYEAFCEEQPDGSKILKIVKKDKKKKDK